VLVEDGTDKRSVSKKATEGVVAAVTVWHGAEDLSSCQLTDAIVDKSHLDGSGGDPVWVGCRWYGKPTADQKKFSGGLMARSASAPIS